MSDADTPIDIAQTIDAPASSKSTGASTHSFRSRFAPKLIHGSTGGLTGEMEALLVERLRAAGLALCFGFAAFFIRRLFRSESSEGPLSSVLFWMHLGMVGVTGLIGFRMCVRCKIVMSYARNTETVLFGSTAAFFALVRE